ncbi:DNA polymerase alpha subunit B, putative [Plasmodium ovale]|uniref:DNA polymerase alpha subunit B n=2 Tax=Plasmodium ovale TaxID=36330 RepID=A0A1A8W0Z0_PLAOA|nr:DNA polymerase alpha subunit, putative [Plasmodium ovale curtisi]SBS96843.1 DNA polymerase alpha subunit, putative [Plasmodium ovale curtisi]SCP05649.1 DNA polymerase alpha subunit B, putative [Plasmodium ovale]
MKEIKQADVKLFLETYYTDNTLSDELKEVFDYFERNKHRNNFFKLFEDYLEEYNKKLLKNENLLKDNVMYDYEYVKQYNSELTEKQGINCNNKYHWHVKAVNTVDEHYKFLGLDSSVIADSINKKISLFLELFLKYSEQMNLNIEISPILNMNEEECYIFGRIYTDNEINISESNIILEGNINWSNGDKAQLLNLNNMKNLCFFLGQMLAIKGKKEINQYSIKYYVSNIYAGLPTHLNVKIDESFLLKHFNCKEIEEDKKWETMEKQEKEKKPNDTLKSEDKKADDDNKQEKKVDDELKQEKNSDEVCTSEKKPDDVHTLEKNKKILQLYNNDNIHIMISNGYVYTDNDYNDNLDNFLKTVNEKLPHAVLIFGPFLYIRNFSETIQKIGDINVIYENIFKKIIKLAKQELLEKTHFFIIPSVYDSVNIYPLPQPPFYYENDTNLTNVHFLSNPSYIYINELKIALTSCDVIYNLSQNLLCRPSEMKSFYLFEQIIRQLTFFPSYPSEYNIEITKFKNLLFQPNRIPDIFLFPSFTNEKSYVKEIHKKLFICPYSIDVSKVQPCNFFSNIYILPPTETHELSKRVILENVFVRDKKGSI